MDMNHVIVVGRLAGKPSLKLYQKKDGTEGARCFFHVATCRLSDRSQKDRAKRRTNFLRVVSWGEAAKNHAKYLDKGTEVTLSGELIVDTQKQEDGTFKEFYHILANDIQYGRRSNKANGPEVEARIAEARNGAAAPAITSNPFEEMAGA